MSLFSMKSGTREKAPEISGEVKGVLRSRLELLRGATEALARNPDVLMGEQQYNREIMPSPIVENIGQVAGAAASDSSVDEAPSTPILTQINGNASIRIEDARQRVNEVFDSGENYAQEAV